MQENIKVSFVVPIYNKEKTSKRVYIWFDKLNNNKYMKILIKLFKI
ncbi:hypothetical protein [Campylobacter pinnipediorum]|nr:hypothetical protein [Campylobacter pinnipediorum]